MAVLGLLLLLLGQLVIADDETWPHRHRPEGHRPHWPHPPPQQHPKYSLTHHYHPYNIPDDFKFMTADDYEDMDGDPTHGFVNYVDRDTARRKGLIKVIRDQLYIGVDHNTVLNTSVQGRDSIRLESKLTWSSGLLIADIAHMPNNECGVWPAFWTYNMEENPIGEIDILEGVSLQPDNIISLHTGPNCKFLPGSQTGIDQRPECELFDMKLNKSNDDGCGMTVAHPFSYGTAFNKVHGGVYATLLDDNAIKIWHWPRFAIPRDILRGEPEPWTWGKPVGDMNKQHGGCDVDSTFHTQTIIINTDFCGDNVPQADWEGEERCAKYPTCPDFVAGHPEAFKEMYWLINSIKVYKRLHRPRTRPDPQPKPHPKWPPTWHPKPTHKPHPKWQPKPRPKWPKPPKPSPPRPHQPHHWNMSYYSNETDVEY